MKHTSVLDNTSKQKHEANASDMGKAKIPFSFPSLFSASEYYEMAMERIINHMD